MASLPLVTTAIMLSRIRAISLLPPALGLLLVMLGLLPITEWAKITTDLTTSISTGSFGMKCYSLTGLRMSTLVSLDTMPLMESEISATITPSTAGPFMRV